MNIAIHRIAGFLMVFAMILGNTIHTKAAENAYYVSPTGNDANPGTASAPFRTFAKANSVLTPGSTLYIYAGVYNQQLKITKNGSNTARITVQPVGGAVVIDRQNAASSGIDVRAFYVTIKNLTVRNSRDVCVNLIGGAITVNGLIVYNCFSHGIQANYSSYVQILNSRVYQAALSNAARLLSGGWGSGIKVRESHHVLVEGNTISHSYGEGIGTRGTDITLRENVVFNNYSVNIYADNSENVRIERNFVYCTPNSGFERGGLPAGGIGLAEEYYPGWGARLKNARVLNNIVAFCRYGVRYLGAEAGVSGAGLKSAVIAYNTLYGSTNAALSVVYESMQAGSVIANNIIWQAQNKLAVFDNPIRITFQNNLWKVAPAPVFRSPGDRYGDPNFVTTPGYTPASFRPSSTSPAAMTASNIGVVNDFYAQARGPMFDIGAIQFFDPAGSSSPTSTRVLLTSTVSPVPTLAQPTNTLQNTASPVPTTNTSAPATSTLSASSFLAMSSPGLVQSSSTATAQPVQSSPETRYDNKHSAFVYSAGWVEEVSAYAIDGSYARTTTNGSSVTFPFTGQSFSVIYKGGPSYRKIDVYIDDVLVATIDERHDASTYKARWDYPGQLSPGPHALKLVFVTTSSNTNGSLDAVIVR